MNLKMIIRIFFVFSFMLIGLIGCKENSIPRVSAVERASSMLCWLECLEGIDIPVTFVAPTAALAIQAAKAESIPPDNPNTIFEIPLFLQ